MQFEWGPRKATINARKHHVAFADAVAVFADRLARVFSDPDHSGPEEREPIVGYDKEGRLLIVSFVERRNNVRIINARNTTLREKHAHEAHIKSSRR